MGVVTRLMGITAGALLILGCVHVPHDAHTRYRVNKVQLVPAKVEPIVVRVTGYGAPSADPGLSPVQRKLLTMRTAKLDALRNLAERVYGTEIYSQSTVRDLVLRNDGFNTVVNALIRGARVTAMTEVAGGGFEATVELSLSPRFQRCLIEGPFAGSACDSPLWLSGGSGSAGALDYVREARVVPRTVELYQPATAP